MILSIAYLLPFSCPDFAIHYNGTYRYIGVRRVELFAGLALFRIHMAWETFLEDVFVRYMCGATSATGYSPNLLQPASLTIGTAMATLLGPRRDYLNWTSGNTLKWAAAYFDKGEPFTTALGATAQVVEDISSVRNCFAHRSEYSKSQFRSVVLQAFGYVPRGMSPGRFLLTPNPAPSSVCQTFLEFYASMLLGASTYIVP